MIRHKSFHVIEIWSALRVKRGRLMEMNRSLLKTVVLMCSVISLGGCVCDSVAMPNLLHPGHISEQQDRMKRFDPFSRSDIGPKIEGDRPAGSMNQTPTPQHLKEYSRR